MVQALLWIGLGLKSNEYEKKRRKLQILLISISSKSKGIDIHCSSKRVDKTEDYKKKLPSNIVLIYLFGKYAASDQLYLFRSPSLNFPLSDYKNPNNG